mgnify:FL=1
MMAVSHTVDPGSIPGTSTDDLSIFCQQWSILLARCSGDLEGGVIGVCRSMVMTVLLDVTCVV